MNITQFDRPTCRAAREEVEAALAEVATRLGISITTGRGSYSTKTFTLKIEMAVVGKDGVVETRERIDFQTYAESFGLNPEMLDQTFRSGSHTFTVVGLKTGAPKYPVIAKRDDGAMYKFPVDRIIGAFCNSPSLSAAVNNLPPPS